VSIARAVYAFAGHGTVLSSVARDGAPHLLTSRSVRSRELRTAFTAKRAYTFGRCAAIMSSTSPRARDAKRARKDEVAVDARSNTTETAGTTTSPSAPVTNSLLASLHAERMKRRGIDVAPASEADAVRHRDMARAITTAPSGAAASPNTLAKIRAKRLNAEVDARAVYEPVSVSTSGGDIRMLTYNIWFADVAMSARLEALGRVITECDPHVLCLQEVTPQTASVLRAQPWFDEYIMGPAPHLQDYFSMMMFKRDVKSELVKREKYVFRNSQMGRYLDVTSYMRDPRSGAHLAVGTSHLESYINSTRTSANERRVQIQECFSVMSKHPNAVFMGDTNWDDKDGDVPMPVDWRDAWLEKRPGEPGFTYDAKSNDMLRGYLQKRLDRAFVKLRDFDVCSIEMVGKQPIPGVTYHKTVSNRGKSQNIELPVLPSDHFGLLVTLRAKMSRAKVASGDDNVESIDLT